MNFRSTFYEFLRLSPTDTLFFPEDYPLEKSMAQFVETQKVANENLSNALAELSRSQAALTQFLLQRENQS